jgi:hypothetical protein
MVNTLDPKIRCCSVRNDTRSRADWLPTWTTRENTCREKSVCRSWNGLAPKCREMGMTTMSDDDTDTTDVHFGYDHNPRFDVLLEQ